MVYFNSSSSPDNDNGIPSIIAPRFNNKCNANMHIYIKVPFAVRFSQLCS